MCGGEGCAKAMDCYRHRAEPNPYRQSYFSPPVNESGECEYFWPIEKGARLAPLIKEKPQ